jgi:hypothetical protein
MMSAASLGLDVSNHFTDDAASRVITGINRELNEETLDLRDEVLSTSMIIPGGAGAKRGGAGWGEEMA